MISIETIRNLAFTLPEVEEMPHFEKTSFRIKNKIFATVDRENHIATFKFSKDDQEFFSSASNGSVYAIDNRWGQKGWTHVELKSIDKSIFKDMMQIAYCEIAPKKLRDQVKHSK
ncbi:MmcQ/YjbR family DNA-binding protein [Leptospira sp. 201903075]|uniref:MmcQ/YjbR family DNA-binding protein n=1 Tax=Leptospira chreensis TaxID=2810035 RepID=UPI0019657160|nr:MmcQ/YjbR family DNA-binding protein [Leptospira chreensis]MBM9592146.1 MmcQ/YjbR family DNA-binding protein [Leptospira chreensis]